MTESKVTLVTKRLHLITDSSLPKNMTPIRNFQRMRNYKESRIGGGEVSEKT